MIYVLSSILLLLWLSSPWSVNVVGVQVQMTVLKRDGRCPSVKKLDSASNEIHQIAVSVIADIFLNTTTPPASTTVMPSSTTNLAKTMSATDYTATVSTMTDCTGQGWRQVAFINMTDTSYDCPTGLRLTTYSKRTCGALLTTAGGCSSTTLILVLEVYSTAVCVGG